ncbi:MAG: thiamine phosphate synthase, partial [Pseudomonadota bacterium]
PEDARDLLGDDAIIGLTIKNRRHASEAPVDLLDYVCIGGVFNTLSKDNPTAIGLDGWSSVAGHFRQTAHRLPVGAIAGIDETNCADVISNGADGVAIISAIFMADDVEAATRDLAKIVQEARR